jgi:hypothetical protein
MSSYKVKTGMIEVRFMKSGDAGFHVARSLKEFIATARESDTEKTQAATNQMLDYLATHPDATIRYHASDMILHILSDTSYL